MKTGKQLIQNYKRRWLSLQFIEGSLYALGLAVLSFVVFTSAMVIVVVFVICLAIFVLIKQPWQLNLTKICNHIDHHLLTAENSTSLLLEDHNRMSGLAQLQHQKVINVLSDKVKSVPTETNLKRAILVFIILISVAFGIYFSGVMDKFNISIPFSNTEEVINFTPANEVTTTTAIPVLQNAKLTIVYPSYTNKPTIPSSQMSVKAVEGTQFFWQLEFDQPIDNVVLEGITESPLPFEEVTDNDVTVYRKKLTPKISGYYNFKFTDIAGATYVSDINAITVTPDNPPVIEIKELAKFSSFEYTEKKQLSFTTEITDDYGIGQAYIIATVSKGSGESVKFREEKLTFDRTVSNGEKSIMLSRKLDLDQLKMELGDELYFYVEAIDLKQPKPNVSRSETYFAVIKDTVTDGFGVEGTLGADLMPDYFRSQRQLIIDTKKLIASQGTLSQDEFKKRSNKLGFDQKSLRLKYGQFMGDEEDSGLAIDRKVPEGISNEDDPTAGYRHDHDSENEHNLVEEQHDDHDAHQEREEASPLEDYLHNHDDPEESTLFTASLRSKLKEAMAQMWDSELHLRMANPKQSLPYQYDALKLIQEIKNSARIYVHRIGFDPPPIKEDKRLSGDLKEVSTIYKKETTTYEDAYGSMRLSTSILEDRFSAQENINNDDRAIFAEAGKELALLAINEPSKHLQTLQYLKLLSNEKRQPFALFNTVKNGLLRAIPEVAPNPYKEGKYKSSLQHILIEELEAGG